MLVPYLEAVVPILTKVILKAYIGPDASDFVGSALTVALKHFGDRGKATKADAAARELARGVLLDIQPWFETELPGGDSPEFYAQELADTLDRGFSERTAVEASLTPDKLAAILVAPKRQDWQLSGPNTATLLVRLIEVVCVPLSRIVPTLPQYAFERDHVILSSLDAIARDVHLLLDGQRTANELIAKFSPEPQKIWGSYEDQYRKALTNNLDYVEILGLDLKREDRKALLSVAYLSLTVDDGLTSADNALRFEDLLLLLPLRGNRLIIEGGAGSGKSTLLRWAAIHFAGGSHAPPSEGKIGVFSDASAARRAFDLAARHYDFSKFDLENLRIKVRDLPKVSTTTEAMEKLKTLTIRSYVDMKPANYILETLVSDRSNKPLVPFLVRLRDLTDGRFPEVDALAKTVVDVGDPPSGWVSSILAEGRAVVLIDGVDEVSEERGFRSKVLGAVRRLAGTFPGNAFIIAGRPGAFTSSPFDSDSPVRVTVNEMDDEQRRIFIGRWHAAKAERQTTLEARNRVSQNSAKLSVELEQNSALRRMASNPLLAASICALHDLNPSTTPKNEYELCERLAKMLVSERDMAEDETGHRVDLAELGRAYALEYADKRTVISRIAGQMLQTGTSTLSWAECRNVVAEVLPSLNRTESVGPDALLSALAIRSGVLRRAISKMQPEEADDDTSPVISREALEFVHNRFKEWFASISYRDRGQPTELANRLPDDPYDQIAIFAVSAEGSETFANDLMDALRLRLAIEHHPSRQRELKLSAVRINDAARVLARDRRTWSTSMHGELFPPSSKAEARALSLLGDTAVPFLKRRTAWTAKQAALAAFCLKLIGTPAAYARLEDYLSDERWTVAQEAVTDGTIIRSQALRKRLMLGKPVSGTTDAKLRTLNGFIELERLTALDLSYTAFDDVNSLTSAVNLSTLNLSSTNVTDITPLSSLAKLKHLLIDNVQTIDFSSLSKLQLAVISLANTKMETISQIGTQTQLSYLSLAGATSSTLCDSMPPLSILTDLDISYNSSKRMGGLSTLKTLLRLHLDGCRFLENIDFLAEMPELQELYISGLTALSDFSVISNNTALSDLRLANSSVSDLTFMYHNAKLRQLNIDNTAVSNISPLASLTHLTRLDMDRTMVSDVSPLSGLPNLQIIFAAGSNISDFTPLLDVPSLEWLSVSHGVDIDEKAFAERNIIVARPPRG